MQENERKELYSYTELKQIADKILDEITKEIDDFYVNATVELFPDYGTINVEIGTPYFEISEAVSSEIENAYNMNEDTKEEIDNMSEEEIEKLYEERYNELLEEINQESCVYVNGKVETQKYTVNFEPLECENDYCVSGLDIEIELKDRIDEVDISNIAQLIITVFRL
jgi:hypothetical protein